MTTTDVYMQQLDPVYSWRRAHLEALVAAYGDNSQAEFARRYGWDRASIAQFLSTSYNNGRSIGEKAAREIELRVSRDFKGKPRWMDLPPGGPHGPLENYRPDNGRKVTSVPRITYAQAALWHLRSKPPEAGSSEFAIWDNTSVQIISLSPYAVVMEGDSMAASSDTRKAIFAGDRLIVDPERVPLPGNAVIAINPVNLKPMVRRLVQEAGHLSLRAEDKALPVVHISDIASIIGVVVDVQREFA